jgi:hypothetical protein
MSPRVIIKLECPHAEYEAYTSTGRGTVTATIICRHTENEGCLCVLDPSVGGECIWTMETEPSERDDDVQENDVQENDVQENDVQGAGT